MVRATDKDPLRFKTWKHRERGYTVNILGIVNLGTNRMVKVDRTQHTQKGRAWTVETFLEAFEPLGRAKRLKSRWDFL